MILTLQTTTFSARGGIPTYNRLVCRALDELDDGGAFGEKRVLIARDESAKGQGLRAKGKAQGAKSKEQGAKGDVQCADATLTPNPLPLGEGRERVRSMEAFGGDNAAFVRRVLATALRERIDLALIGHVNYAPLGMMLKRLQPAMRWGVIVYGVEVWSRLPWMKRRALQAADFVASISEYTKAKMVDVNGVRAERVHILTNTIEWSGQRAKGKGQRAKCQQTPGVSGQWSVASGSALSTLPLALSARPLALSALPFAGPRVLSVARLESGERYKGVDTVIEALPSVITQAPGLEYVVVGSGSDLERHRRLALELGVAERVHFLGSVDDETLRRCYQDCDLFVLPSAGEGFGIVFLEAMSYAKAVIAANSGAAPEVVKDRETGLLVEYGNVGQLAEAITSLCLNSGLRKRFGEAGHERLESEFTFAQFKEKLGEIVMREMPVRALYLGRREAVMGMASRICDEEKAIAN
jgi:glycosyltransferase involved in cell wall biosynthesis